MGQCLTCCWPPAEPDSVVVSDERQPLLGPSPCRIVDHEPDDAYPRDDEQSKLNKIVQDTARTSTEATTPTPQEAHSTATSPQQTKTTSTSPQSQLYQSTSISPPDTKTISTETQPYQSKATSPQYKLQESRATATLPPPQSKTISTSPEPYQTKATSPQYQPQDSQSTSTSPRQTNTISTSTHSHLSEGNSPLYQLHESRSTSTSPHQSKTIPVSPRLQESKATSPQVKPHLTLTSSQLPLEESHIITSPQQPFPALPVNEQPQTILRSPHSGQTKSPSSRPGLHFDRPQTTLSPPKLTKPRTKTHALLKPSPLRDPLPRNTQPRITKSRYVIPQNTSLDLAPLSTSPDQPHPSKRGFVDIHSADAPVTNNSRDKESIYQCVQGSTLATMPSSNSTSLPNLPDCAASPTEIFSKTTVTHDDLSLIQDGAAQANEAMDFKIKNTDNVVETFDGTPKV